MLTATSPQVAPIKPAANRILTLDILFLTYHYGVRNTWLGVLLNGRRYPIN